MDPLPTFLVIGAMKAGTTTLHHYLDKHPQVPMSRPKEINFFIHRFIGVDDSTLPPLDEELYQTVDPRAFRPAVAAILQLPYPRRLAL